MSLEDHIGIHEGGVTTERLEGLWETAWNFLEKTAEPPVTDTRQVVRDGNWFIEVQSTWDNDNLDTLTIVTRSAGLGNRPEILKLNAVVSYKRPGFDNMEWEFAGGISDNWIERVERVLNQMVDQAETTQT